MSEEGAAKLLPMAAAPGVGLGIDIPAEAAADMSIREDQVQSAVQFLVHPKVQSSSMEERRKFLVKKGLNTREIDEAIKLAQPELGRLQAARPAVAPVAPAQGTFAEPSAPKTKPTAKGAMVDPSHNVHSAVKWPDPESGVQGWGKVILATAAVVGLGSGLGLLVKKAMSKDGVDNSVWNWGGNQAAERERRQDQEKIMVSMMEKLDAMQNSMLQNTRTLEQLSSRVGLLESRPSHAEIKADVMAGVNAALANQAMSDVKADIASFKTLLSSALNPSNPFPSSFQSQGSASSTINHPAGPPPGLPHVRAFRKVGARGTSTPPAPDSQQQVAQQQQQGDPPYSASFKEVLNMVQQGGVPPDVRQIDDKVKFPDQKPTPSSTKPKVKPWERNLSPMPSQAQQRAPQLGQQQPTASVLPNLPVNGVEGVVDTAAQVAEPAGASDQFPANGSTVDITPMATPMSTPQVFAQANAQHGAMPHANMQVQQQQSQQQHQQQGMMSPQIPVQKNNQALTPQVVLAHPITPLPPPHSTAQQQHETFDPTATPFTPSIAQNTLSSLPVHQNAHHQPAFQQQQTQPLQGSAFDSVTPPAVVQHQQQTGSIVGESPATVTVGEGRGKGMSAAEAMESLADQDLDGGEERMGWESSVR